MTSYPSKAYDYNNQNHSANNSPYSYQQSYKQGIQKNNIERSFAQQRNEPQSIGHNARIAQTGQIKQNYFGIQGQGQTYGSPLEVRRQNLNQKTDYAGRNNQPSKQSKQSRFQSKFQKQPALKLQNQHTRATLLMVLAGFSILVLIVSIFYGIIAWDKSHLVQPSTISLNSNTASTASTGPRVNNQIYTSIGELGISEDEKRSELDFLDKFNNFVGLEAHLYEDSKNHQISRKLKSKHLHMRTNQI